MSLLNRRQLLATTGVGLLLLQSGLFPVLAQPNVTGAGRLKQSVARWCFGAYTIEELCQSLQAFGVTGMDLVGPDEWDVCKKYGITPCMVQGAGTFLAAAAGSNRRFGRSFGWNKTENHASLLETATLNAGLASTAGLHNMIGLFGDREGMSDE